MRPLPCPRLPTHATVCPHCVLTDPPSWAAALPRHPAPKPRVAFRSLLLGVTGEALHAKVYVALGAVLDGRRVLPSTFPRSNKSCTVRDPPSWASAISLFIDASMAMALRLDGTSSNSTSAVPSSPSCTWWASTPWSEKKASRLSKWPKFEGVHPRELSTVIGMNNIILGGGAAAAAETAAAFLASSTAAAARTDDGGLLRGDARRRDAFPASAGPRVGVSHRPSPLLSAPSSDKDPPEPGSLDPPAPAPALNVRRTLLTPLFFFLCR